jgi:hypothetical protein
MDTAFIGGIVAFPDSAQWIGLAPSAFAAAPLGTTQLRTTFDLPVGAVATRARAYVAAPGYYSLYIDGKMVDEARVLGAFTVFTRKILYDVIDVTPLLLGGGDQDRGDSGSTTTTTSTSSTSTSNGGRHALALTLANGWYSQPTVNLGPRMVSLVLRIDYTMDAQAQGGHVQGGDVQGGNVQAGNVQGRNAQGENVQGGHAQTPQRVGTMTVVSDGAWRETHGPETGTDIYLGTTHDARQETPGWRLGNYTEGGAAGRWRAAAVLPSPLLPGMGIMQGGQYASSAAL